MPTVFGHVNIVAGDWRRLSRFYQDVFGCQPLPPVRQLSGARLEAGTGVPGAELEGEHLRLPGHGPDGPTLEIFSYSRMLEKPMVVANRRGLAHLAFQVDDVATTLERLLSRGGHSLGSIARLEVPGRGTVTFVYARDPEDNIVELQSWSPGPA